MTGISTGDERITRYNIVEVRAWVHGAYVVKCLAPVAGDRGTAKAQASRSEEDGLQNAAGVIEADDHLITAHGGVRLALGHTVIGAEVQVGTGVVHARHASELLGIAHHVAELLARDGLARRSDGRKLVNHLRGYP